MSNIVINGATYKDVPSIQVPDENGEMVEFREKSSPRTSDEIADEIEATFIANGWTKVEDVPADLNQLKAWEYASKRQFIRVEELQNDNTLEKVGNVIIENLLPTSNIIRNYQYDEVPNLAITSLPEGVASIGIASFSNCSNLAIKNLPKRITSIPSNCFSYCQNITNLELHEGITAIDDYSFTGCSNLQLKLPSTLTNLGSYAFSSCSNLSLSSIPKAITEIKDYCFYRCFNITNLELHEGITSIGNGSFTECPISSLTIRNSSDCITLKNSNSFNKLKKINGYIYVPSALIDSYKSATNWSVYANQFRALEDYTVDGTVTGELDENKI